MYIADYKSLSEDEIKADLLKFIEGQADGAKWLDYFGGSHGTTILELCSGIGALLSYQASQNRRETNILTAKLKSSLYAMAYTLGYPINRKLSAKVELTLNNPSPNPVYWVRDIPIGYFSGSPISLLHTQQLEPGLNKVECVVGEWKNFTTSIREYQDHYQLKIPLNHDIDLVDNELLEVSVDGLRVNYTRYLEAMDQNTIAINTQLNHVVLTFGSSNFGRPIQINSSVSVDYLLLKETTVSDPAQAYTLANLQIDQTFECSGVKLIRREQPADDLQKIARIMPAYFSSKRRMVTPTDHEAIVSSYAGVQDAKFARGICSVDPLNKYNESLCVAVPNAKWSKVAEGCCTQVMSYLLYNEKAWSATEEDLVYAYLEDFQIAGEHIIFRKGEPVLVNVTATVVLKPTAIAADVKKQIEAAIKAQCYLLGGTFNLAKLMVDINKIEGVYHAYLIRPFKDRKLAFYGYFKPGTTTINFQSVDNADLNTFADKTGGYTPDIP